MSQADEASVNTCVTIQEDLVKLTSIKESLLDGPDKDTCKQMGETMGGIIESLRANTSCLTIKVQARNNQSTVSTVPAQDNIQKREQSPDKKSGWSFPSFSLTKKPKKVQIMNPTLTHTTKMFISAMANIVEDYDCTIIGKNDPFDKQIPLIVVCPNSSRLLPDVELALETIERPFEHVVIIIHTGSETNLPAIPSRKKIGSYKEVIFIDMGYEQHSGIYKCNHNIEAAKTLKAFIKRFYASIK